MENKISVVINTYNAEEHLREVLESVKSFDEIVVCDMESTDSTVQIAEEFGCKVVVFPKGNHTCAEPARTFAIQSASHKWVFVVDADELVPDALRDYLYKRISEHDCPQGLYIPRKNYFMGQFMHSFYPDYLLRFFIKEGTEWPPYAHTFPQVKGKTEKMPKDEKYAFIHLANEDVRFRLSKTDLYTESELLKKAGKHYGTIALLWRPFFRFFKAYILKGGIRDGKPGFIRAVFEGIYQFVMIAKMEEQRRKGK